MADLTDADIAAIERRLSEGRMAATIPQPRPLAGWEKEAADAQAARREQRRIAAQAEQERLIREREREAERRRLEWEANAPQRAEAQAERPTSNARSPISKLDRTTCIRERASCACCWGHRNERPESRRCSRGAPGPARGPRDAPDANHRLRAARGSERDGRHEPAVHRLCERDVRGRERSGAHVRDGGLRSAPTPRAWCAAASRRRSTRLVTPISWSITRASAWPVRSLAR